MIHNPSPTGKISQVCGVTIYAVIFSLIPLPAVLMCFGPCGARGGDRGTVVGRGWDMDEKIEWHLMGFNGNILGFIGVIIGINRI